MSEEIKLLPCPHDGGEAKLIVGDGYLQIRCSTCLAGMDFNPRKSDEAKAIAVWNRRTPSTDAIRRDDDMVPRTELLAARAVIDAQLERINELVRWQRKERLK